MARPRLALGTYGAISTRKINKTTWMSTGRYRDLDGATRKVETRGRTKTEAETAFKERCRERTSFGGPGGALTKSTTLAELGSIWLDDQELEGHSANTMRVYRIAVENHITVYQGQVMIGELTTNGANRLIRSVQTHHGASSAKLAKTVLSGMCKYAVNEGVITKNVVREVGSIKVKPKTAPKSFTWEQILDLRQKVAADPQAIDRDLPALVMFQQDTGMRIGECLAVTEDCLNLEIEKPTITVKQTAVYRPGLGEWIQAHPKSDASIRTFELPSELVPVIRARLATGRVTTINYCESQRGTEGQREWTEDRILLFPMTRYASKAGLRNQSNVLKQLADAFEKAGYGRDVKSHTFRKSLVTMMLEAGIPLNKIADHMGHDKLLVDVYVGRKKFSDAAAGLINGKYLTA